MTPVSAPPTADAAWSWVQERARSFLELIPEIYATAHRAAAIAGAARERGDAETHRQARDAVERLMTLWRRAETLRPTVERIAGTGAGLGQPWALLGLTAGTIVAVAAAVAWIQARYGAEASIVAMLDDGTLTPDAAADLLAGAGRAPSILGSIGSALGLGVAALIGLLLIRGRS